MRLFTGISIGPPVLQNLENLIGSLSPTAALNWSPVENLHITSKFIGEWPPEKLPALQEALAALDPPGELDIAVSGLGFVPNPHHPRFCFAALDPNSGLTELAGKMNDAIAVIGAPREDRPYLPHITLGRIKTGSGHQSGIAGLRELREHIATMKTSNFGTFRARHFHLYLSSPGPAQSAYRKLSSYALLHRSRP